MDTQEANDYVTEVLLDQATPIKRKHSSNTDTENCDLSPDSLPPPSKMANNENEEKSLKDLLTGFVAKYETDMQVYKNDLDAIKSNISSMNTNLTTVKEDLLVEVSGVKTSVTQLDEQFESMKSEYDARIAELEKKIIELPCTTKDFPVELSCVISGMRPANNENLSQRCDDLIQNGLGLKNVKCKKATRVGNRDGKPGIIKVEFDNLTDKISVLRAKGHLKNNPATSKVFIRSSKSHEQRILEQHTMELLKLIGRENDFYFNGSGKLMQKSADRNRSNENKYSGDVLALLKSVVSNPELVSTLQKK